jgi:hypothetical protein
MQEHPEKEAYLLNLFIIIIHIFFSKLIKHTLKRESVLRIVFEKVGSTIFREAKN